MIKLRTILAVLAIILCVGTADAKTYLVSVGIADYPGFENDLNLPANDAATVVWLYKENNNCETAMLTNSDATVANVKAKMKTLYMKAGTNDNIVLFFSGHGVKGGFVCYDGFLTYKDVRSIMKKSKCKNKIIFADACFSGAIRQSGTSSTSDYTSMKNSNLLLFLSSRTTEMSQELPGYTNGLFTYALQHALRGNADANGDRTITAKELFTFVSNKVIEESKSTQHPVMWGKFPNNMPVMKW